IFDDHDVADDWNLTARWRDRVRVLSVRPVSSRKIRGLGRGTGACHRCCPEVTVPRRATIKITQVCWPRSTSRTHSHLVVQRRAAGLYWAHLLLRLSPGTRYGDIGWGWPR